MNSNIWTEVQTQGRKDTEEFQSSGYLWEETIREGMRRVTILAICLFLKKKNSEANMAKYIRLLYLTKKIKRQTDMLLYLDVYIFNLCVFQIFLKS